MAVLTIETIGILHDFIHNNWAFALRPKTQCIGCKIKLGIPHPCSFLSYSSCLIHSLVHPIVFQQPSLFCRLISENLRGKHMHFKLATNVQQRLAHLLSLLFVNPTTLLSRHLVDQGFDTTIMAIMWKAS